MFGVKWHAVTTVFLTHSQCDPQVLCRVCISGESRIRQVAELL